MVENKYTLTSCIAELMGVAPLMRSTTAWIGFSADLHPDETIKQALMLLNTMSNFACSAHVVVSYMK